VLEINGKKIFDANTEIKCGVRREGGAEHMNK
jgi:hypothetical protein